MQKPTTVSQTNYGDILLSEPERHDGARVSKFILSRDEAPRVALDILRQCGIDLDAETLERAAEQCDDAAVYRRADGCIVHDEQAREDADQLRAAARALRGDPNAD